MGDKEVDYSDSIIPANSSKRMRVDITDLEFDEIGNLALELAIQRDVE